MGKTVRVEAAISEELDASLERLAGERGESKDALIQHALQAFVQTEAEFVVAVQEGLDAWAAGEGIDHADVVAEFNRRYGRGA